MTTFRLLCPAYGYHQGMESTTGQSEQTFIDRLITICLVMALVILQLQNFALPASASNPNQARDSWGRWVSEQAQGAVNAAIAAYEATRDAAKAAYRAAVQQCKAARHQLSVAKASLRQAYRFLTMAQLHGTTQDIAAAQGEIVNRQTLVNASQHALDMSWNQRIMAQAMADQARQNRP